MKNEHSQWEIHSCKQLNDLYSAPSQMTMDVILNRLDEHFKKLLGEARFVCIATESGNSIDVSPRGGERGFVKIINERKIAIPDWPGNNKIGSLRNIVKTKRVGTLFLFPDVRYFLRINGPAVLSRDPILLESMVTRGKQPKLAIIITVEEAFFHCGKAIFRSEIWKPSSWPASTDVPSSGKMLSDQIKSAKMTPAEIEQFENAAYRDELY